MQFGQSFAGASFLVSTLIGAEPHVTVYALEREGRRRVAIVNKGDSPVNVELPSRAGVNAMRLGGRSLESKDGTVFGEVHVARSRDVVVKAHTAMSFEL